MGDVQTWAYLVGTPAWLAFLVYVVRTVRDWPNIMQRWNERQRDKEAAKDGDWKRLRGEIERLDARCAETERKEQECQRQLSDALHRIGELEGYNMGRGEAKQDAQRMLSEEREIDAAARKAGREGK